MISQTHQPLAVFMKELAQAEKGTGKKENLVLGKTFTSNTEAMKIISALSGTGTAHLPVKDPVAAFYVFTLLCHRCFNNYLKKMVPAFEIKIEAIAAQLAIHEEDRLQLLDFFLNEEPYTDKINAVYFNNDKKAENAKYIGANILHAQSRSNEIVYLKYFKRYDVFLSKTFIKNNTPYYFLENIMASELNIITPANYFAEDYGNMGFDDIVASTKTHRPFRYYELAATANTPKIVLDPEEGKIVISGSSSPFSPTQFFRPVLDWLQDYDQHCKKPLQVCIMLDYFNTYTSKFLLAVCRQCDRMSKTGAQVKIYWYFDPEDADMREFGEHMGTIYKKGIEYCSLAETVEELA